MAHDQIDIRLLLRLEADPHKWHPRSNCCLDRTLTTMDDRDIGQGIDQMGREPVKDVDIGRDGELHVHKMRSHRRDDGVRRVGECGEYGRQSLAISRTAHGTVDQRMLLR